MPAALGYRMPAEWEPHAATWLAWPHYHGDWPGKFEPIPWVYTEIIRNLARHERVELIVNDAAAERQVRKLLDRANALFAERPLPPLADQPRLDARLRLHLLHRPCGDGTPPASPTGASAQDELLALKFRFNAWAKYSNWRHDEKIGT